MASDSRGNVISVQIPSFKSAPIVYFEKEGRENLPHVLKVLKRILKKRIELRVVPIIIFTATGEGPARAYAQLNEYDPKIIAVTFGPDFSVKRGDETYVPRISDKLASFFHGVGIDVLTGRLPFDPIDGVEAHNNATKAIRDVLTLFGGGFALAVEAVLSACDAGYIDVGDQVLALTADTLSVMTASTTRKFLSKSQGLVINEILCKPRMLTVSRAVAPPQTYPLFNEKSLAKVIDLKSLADENPPRE